MKKVVTIDALMVALFSTVGYGMGYVIPTHFGLNMLFSTIICMIVGMFLDSVGNKVMFSRNVQENKGMKALVYLGAVIFFVAGGIASFIFFEHSIFSDLGLQAIFVLILPVIGFVISFVIRSIKYMRLKKKYGDGKSGYIMNDKDISAMEALNGENAEITEEYDEELAIKTATGTYVGRKSGKAVAFLGIPYAKAPIGDLRWKAPQEPDAPDKIYEAYYYGPSEIQPENNHNILSHHKQSEDCLYLNVWCAQPGDDKKPVFVYIHGGDGRYGGCANPMYNFDNMVSENPNAVYVSFNYRIGLFGVVDFSEVGGKEEYEDSVALTLLDQIQALKWIKANIAAFGGDADNIIVAGDTAGATSICLLSVMPEAKGLFKKAIVITGSAGDSMPDSDYAKELGTQLCKAFGKTSADELKSVTSDELRAICEKLYGCIELSPRGNKHLPKDVFGLMAQGAAADIEFIFVIAADDASGWQGMLADEVDVNEIVNGYYEDLYNKIGDRKPLLEAEVKKRMESGCSETEARRSLLADIEYKSKVIHNIKALVKGGAKVRCVYWDTSSQIEKFTANTIAIVTSVFGNDDIAESMGYLNSPEIGEAMRHLIVKFMNNISPELYNNEIKGMQAVDWHPYTEDSDMILHVSERFINCETGLFKGKIEELENMYYGCLFE